MNHEAVYRTAPATPGLLKIAFFFCIGPTIRIGRESQCLLYAGFFNELALRPILSSSCNVSPYLAELCTCLSPPNAIFF